MGERNRAAEALKHLQACGQLTYYPSRDAWGGPEYDTRTVQALVARRLAWCSPLAAYPTADGLCYDKTCIR